MYMYQDEQDVSVVLMMLALLKPVRGLENSEVCL